MRLMSGSRTARRGAVAVTAAVALALTGCGGEAGPDEGGDRTLTVWIMEGTNPDVQPFFAELSAAFQQRTGATLDVQFMQWGGAHDRFVTAIAGNTTPDVAELGTTWVGEFGASGALVDIGPRMQESGLADGFNDVLVESGTLDGALYGMPWYAGVRSVLYRTDVFAELGLTPPTTWDELVTVGQRIKEARPDLVPLPIAGDDEFVVYPFLWGTGGEIATRNGDTWTSGVDSPESRAGIQFYADLALKHGLSTPAAANWRGTDVRDAFMKGQAAMIVSGNWQPKDILEKAPDLHGKIGAFPLPGRDGGLAPSVLGGSLLSIFESSDDPDLAWQLVEMMGTGEFAAKWAEESSYFPGTTELLNAAVQSPDPLVAPFARQMVESGRNVPITPAFGQIQGDKTVAKMMRSILTGEATVEQATSTAAAEMNEIFARGA
jgi:N,N'-diacetylchitobiose transport system substrate-binding protein